MPELYFSIGADFDRVKKLKDDIKGLEQQLLNTDKAADPKHIKELERKLASAKKEFRNLSDEAAIAAQKMKAEMASASQTMDGLKGQFAQIGATMAGMFAVTGLSDFVSKVIEVRGEMQQLEVAFTTMLGSEEKANDLLQQLTKTAATTPFGMTDVANGAKALMAYGVSADEVNETLRRMGDIAAGMSIPLNDMTMLFGTTMVQGRMFTQDLRQFQGRGIPIAEALADVMGVTADKVGDLVTAGKVGAEEFKQAMWKMTDEGGKFGGLMEAQSKTITGQISNLEDGIDMMFNDIGKQSEGIISTAIGGLNTLVENYETVGKVLTGLIGTYGAYKAAVIASTAINKVVTKQNYAEESAQLKELLGYKERSIESDMAEAVSKGQLSQAEADLLIKMRAEAEQRAAQLQADADAAKEAADAIREKADAAQKEFETADELTSKAAEQLEVARASGDATRIEAAQKEMNTAATIKNSAAKQANALRTEANAAAQKASAAQTQADTVAQQVNTVAKTGASKATTLLQWAQAKLNATMLANPYVLAAAAIAALGYAIYKVATYETETEKATKKMNEEFSKSEASAAQETEALDGLVKSLDPLKEGTKEYAQAKEKLVEMAKKYGKTITDEKGNIKDLTAAYKELKDAIHTAALEKGLANYEASENERYSAIMSEQMEEIQQEVNDEIKDTKEAAKVYQRIMKSLDEGTLKIRKEWRSGPQGGGFWETSIDTQDEELKAWVKKIEGLGTGFQDLLKDYTDEAEQHATNLDLGRKRFGYGNKQTQDEIIKYYQNAVEAQKKAQAEYDAAVAEGYEDEIEKAKERLEKSNKDLEDAKEKLSEADITEERAQGRNGELQRLKTRFAEAAKAYVDAIKSGEADKLAKAKEEYYKALEEMKTNHLQADAVQTYQQAKAIAKQAMDDAEKAWKDAEKEGRTQTEVLSLRETYNEKKKEYESLSGSKEKTTKPKDDTKAREDAAQRTADILAKIEEDSQKMQTANMEDGIAKRMQKIEDEHRERIAATKKNISEIAKLNVKAGVKNVGEDGLTDEQRKIIESAQQQEDIRYNQAKNKELETANQYKEEWIKEYGSLQEKRQQIAEQYDKQIAETSDKWQRMTLERKKQDALDEFDLSPYQKFAKQRTQLEKDYQEQRALAMQETDEQIRAQRLQSIEAQHKESLAAINKDEANYAIKYSAVLGHAFSNIEKQTKEGLQKSIKVLQQLKQRGLDKKTKVDGVSDAEADKILSDPETLAKVLDQLQNAQNQLETSNPFKSIFSGLKNIASGAKLAAEEYENLTEEEKAVYKQAKENQSAMGVEQFTNGLSDASNYAGSLADTLGKMSNVVPGLSKTSEALEEVSTVLGETASYAGTGAQIGGGWGALAGAIVGIGVGFASIWKSSEQLQEENAANLKEFANRVKQMSHELEDKYDTIFGTKSLQKAVDAYDIAKKTLGDYVESAIAMEQQLLDADKWYLQQAKFSESRKGYGWSDIKSSAEYEEDISNLEASIEKKRALLSSDARASLKDYKQMIDETTSSLKNLDGVQTKEFKWYKIGSKNKYNKLSEYDIWQEDGALDVDKAKVFLETQSKITDEAKEQLQAAIDMNEQYSTLVEALDEEIKGFFGSWGSDLTDMLYDSIYNGEDAWDGFHDKATETIADLGKQLAQQFIVQSYLDKYQDQLREAFALVDQDNGASVISTIDSMMSGMGTVMESAQQFADEYQKAAEKYGYNLASVYSKQDEEQEASKGAFQTMSEDTASELNGRFTALQISGEQLVEHSANIENIAADIQSIMAQSVLELVQIRDNTFAVVEPIRLMQTDIRKMQRKMEAM